MKTHLIAGKRTRVLLVTLAGGCLLAPAAAFARVPYQSAAKQAPIAASAASLPTQPTSAATADCESGSCVRPVGGLEGLASNDHRYGTAIDWSDTPEAAGKLAAKDSKLVFLIQLSGDFTNAEFT